MPDDRQQGPHAPAPVPRDLPDQQASQDEDPLEVCPPSERSGDSEDHEDVPDTSEAGTGRRGAPHSAGVHPDHPVPDESSG